MTRMPEEISADSAQAAATSGQSQWTLLSPGTGGNMHSLAFHGDDNVWVGADNAGLMLGQRVSDLAWYFTGRQQNIRTFDIASIDAVNGQDEAQTPLVYALADGGYGGGGPSDRTIYRIPKTGSAIRIAQNGVTHLWPMGTPPTAVDDAGQVVYPDPKSDLDKVRVLKIQASRTSLVQVLPLPDGRHLVITGGNSGSASRSGWAPSSSSAGTRHPTSTRVSPSPTGLVNSNTAPGSG